MEKIIVSKQGRLNWRDLLRGFIMAVLAPVLFVIQDSLAAGQLEFDWKAIGTVAGIAAVAYLLKQLGEPPKVITTYKDNAHAEATADEIKSKL